MDNKPFCFAGLGELFQEFQQFQLLFYGFFRLFRCGQGAVLEISAVSATFLEIFPAISLWLGELFQKFQQFQLLFSRIFPVFGLDWGAVLEVLWITATQGLSAINIWLLYTMLIQCGDIMLKNKNDGSYWICGEGVGTEQKTVSGETEYTVTCSSKFVPYEFPANEFSK